LQCEVPQRRPAEKIGMAWNPLLTIALGRRGAGGVWVMSGLNADNLLAAAAVWVAIMLPSAAFGGDPAPAAPSFKQCPAMEASASAGVQSGHTFGRAV